MIVKGDGSRMLVDYAAVMNDAGKYTAYSPKIYDVVPIGMHLSSKGNFLVTTLSVGRMFDKLNAWSERMPARLAPWGGSKDAFFKEFTEKYLQNWQNGVAGETGLSGDRAEALAKKDIFNDFLNLTTNDFRGANMDRTKTPRRRGDARGKDVDRTIMSMRLDHMAELMDNDSAPKVPIDYGKAIKNFMPAEETASEPAQEERRQTPFDGITATYTTENRPIGVQYANPSGAELTANLIASGTSLESFGKETLSQLAKFYGMNLPETAKRGEIIDALNERPAQSPLESQPQETKFVFTTSTKRDEAIKNLIETGNDQGIRDLNKSTILHVLSDMKHIPVTIEDTKGVYQGEKEVSSIIRVTTDNQQDLNKVRSRIADAAKMFQQMEFLEEKMGAGNRNLFGEIDEDGFKHIGSSTLFVEGVTEDQIEAARKQVGLDGLTLADGRIEMYDRSDDPEFFNRVTAFDTAIRQAGGVVASSEAGVASVKSYSEDPQQYAGTIGYDDQSLHLYSKAGEQERLKTPLIQNLMGLMGRPMEAPQGGRKSYFDARDVTPEQVGKQNGIARRFKDLPRNDLESPLVTKAYQHLNTEIAKQYDYLTKGKDGTKFTSQPWSEGGEPYENSSEAINDIRTKNSLKFLKTDPSSFGPKGEDFSYHPLLQDSGRKDANGVSLVYNDLFRAVHDAIAHGLFGAEFGPVGEESAWQTHMRTLDDPWARWALTTETRGQNSFVNYRDEMLGADGMPLKKGDEGYIPLKERGFAEQKAALLPLEDSLTGDKKVDEVTRKLMEELGEKQSQGSAGGISFMPAAGESKPVPTQEKLDEMKARLPKYKSEIEEYEDGRFMVIVRDEDGKFVGQAEATIDGGNKQTDIHESFVDDQYRSQGYGEALYREIAKYSQEKGSESLYGEPISIDALRVRQKLFDTQVEPNPFIEDEAGVRSKVPSDIAFMPADKMDEEYAKSIRFDADPKEARKIVDQAAEKAGYDSSRYWYHGTAGDSFNVPKGRRGVAAHVSLNKEEAWNFAESAPSASSRGGAKPNVREWYLKKGELFDPTNEDHLKKVSDSIEPVREGIRNQPLGGQWALKDDTYNPKTWKDKVWDFFEDSEIQNFIKDAGFIGYMDRESTRTPWENTENAAIFDPNSLKEASLITLDDNKNIIPLSQRFDTSKQDIRFMPESRGEDELVGQDTRRYTGKAPEHDWRKADLQMNVPWSEEVVAEFLGVTEDQNIYKGMIDLSDLNPSVVEFETAKEIRSGEQEVEQMYLDQAEEMLDRYTSEENVNDRFFTKSRGEFEEWQDHLPWDHTSGYDESDVEDLAREMQARDQGGYDEEEYATPRSSGYPPIVVTRKADGSLQIEDGNHRVDTWQKAGYDVAPAWINDEMLRSKEQGGVQFMPYSPELPKTEDGKVDWAGFKAKTLEIAKPLADLRPLGGVSFMPADRPIRKDEPLPEFNSTIIKDVASIEDFKWDRPANVEFDLEDGRKMSFSYDPKYLQVPKFKDLLEELTGEPVILLEADRQRATGGDMGGPLHPFLLSNQVTITGPDGKEYKAVWANMTSTFVSGTKNRMAAHGAKYALVHLMDSMAHKSNKRTARTLDKLMRESNLDQFQKEIVSLAMQGGIIAGKKAALSAGITALGRVLKDSKLSKEDVAKINKLIKEKAAQRDALTPIGMDAEIFKKITAIKTAQSNLNTGRWKQSSLDNAIENLKEFTKTKEYKALLKKNKSLYISDNIGNTFNDRGSAIGSILSLKFGKFEPSKIMRESSDFREGENLDIVTAVELSQNPEMFALYFGKDAKEEAAMSPAERKARDEMRANPNFVEHEAYDWVMLGPKNGNNFLVKNPVKPEQLFKNYRKAHPKKSVKEGSDESVAGAMRKYAGIKLLVGKDAVKMPSTTKNKK
jgi:ribosomal protein S18 acetylase RimI-like enzyme